MRRLLVLALLASSCSPATPDAVPPQTSPGARSEARVIRVVDGDTVWVSDGGRETRVRLIGIDAPEERHPGRPGECFARQATAFLRTLVRGEDVELETDEERHDRFGRLLAYLWLGDQLVNETLVAEGYAVAGTYPPNVRYQPRLDAAERRARAEGWGMWGAC